MYTILFKYIILIKYSICLKYRFIFKKNYKFKLKVKKIQIIFVFVKIYNIIKNNLNYI